MKSSQSHKAPSQQPKASNNSHVGNSPAVSPAYAHNQNISNRAINKAMSVKPRKAK